LAFDETLRYVVSLFRFDLCMVSCEFDPCEESSHSPFTPVELGRGLHLFFWFGNLMLLELLEAVSRNISVVGYGISV
jgi:hypothetical protein